MRLVSLIDDPVALARELENGRLPAAGEAGASSLGQQIAPFFPFAEQVEFAQRFIKIVSDAKKDRDFAAHELKSSIIGNPYDGKSPAIEVMLPVDEFRRFGGIHGLFGVSGSGKTEILARLRWLLRREDSADTNVMASPIYFSCESVRNEKDLYNQLLLGLERVLKRQDISAAAWGRTTALSDVPQNVVNLCLGYRLECLILDEIDYLSELPLDHQEVIVRFLMRLSGEAGVPIFLAGTAAGWDFVDGHHALSKTLVGDRKTFLGTHPNTVEWQCFVDSLCVFYLGENARDFAKTHDAIHDHTQGIPRFTHVLLSSAAAPDHLQCINAAEEADRPDRIIEVFREVAANQLHPIQNVLDALRANDPALLRAYRQYGPLELDFSELEAKHRAKIEGDLREAEERRRSDYERELLASLTKAENDNDDAGATLEMALGIVVRSIGLELGCAEDNIERYARQALDELKNTYKKAESYTHPREYLTKVLRRLEADRKDRAAELRKSKVRKQRLVGAKDLRSVLRAGKEVPKALERAGYRPQSALERIAHGPPRV